LRLSQIVLQDQKVRASDEQRSILAIHEDLDPSRNDVRTHGAVVLVDAVAQAVLAAEVPLHVLVDDNDRYSAKLG
jgi:hypothetical protein